MHRSRDNTVFSLPSPLPMFELVPVNRARRYVCPRAPSAKNNRQLRLVRDAVSETEAEDEAFDAD